MPLIIISNPACGAGVGQQFVEEHVLPYLKKNGKEVAKVVVTEGQDHAGHLLLQSLQSTEGDSNLEVILSSGDGTLHEIINVLARNTIATKASVKFALVPSGTANALYSTLYPPSPTDDTNSAPYKLKSVQSLVEGGRTAPLTLAATSFETQGGGTSSATIFSAVVVSAALHASILHDSEALRKEIPDLGRFKVAAQKNITRWYNSRARFHPGPTGRVQIYDPNTKSFIDYAKSTKEASMVDLEGPFEYFLSTMNADRLEPAFQITPLQSRIRPESEGWMDVVVVRPLRDKSMTGENENDRNAFAYKAGAVLQGAYRQGSHIDMKYNTKGEVSLEGDGEPVVEYIRCGGWEWIPDMSDEYARLICCDGAIHEITNGGKAVCTIAKPSENVELHVYT